MARTSLIQPQLSPEFVSYLRHSELWRNICADRELSPEIRNGVITIYCYGRTLLRGLKLEHGTLSATVNHSIIPLRRIKPSSVYLELRSNELGSLDFADRLMPAALGNGSPSTISAYKRLLKFQARPEDILRHRIAACPDNFVVDQQIEFPGDDHNKFDFCCFDPLTGELCFALIKCWDDLRSLDRDGEPKVLHQLTACGSWLARTSASIAKVYRRVVDLKRELGLADRLTSIPEGDLEVSTKPVFIVGNCTRRDDRLFRQLERREPDSTWMPLWSRLSELTSRVVLAKPDGDIQTLRHNARRRASKAAL